MTNKNIIILILTLIVIVTFLGLPLDLMEPDAALYGSISKIIHENNDFVNLYSLGKDWLDKPHLPFWLTAISFKIFGVSNIAYKIPGVLIFFFGVWITYRFTKENYNKETAILAAIILATSQHSIISNFDVRAEPYLTGFIIASMYWFYKYIKNKKINNLVIACFFSGLAVMTKGIFALIPIAAAIGGEFLVKRKWKELLNPMWLLAFLLIFIFIIPELYTLYIQFDTHPEKVVFGRTNVSGLRFFFWDSQFGRFFNTGPIKGSGDPLFFFHTILWAFLPWGILFYIASFLKIKRNSKAVQHNEEFYTFFGAFATLAIFSLSKFQLPHYSNIVFPFMAIITADFIHKLSSNYLKLKKSYTVIQYVIMGIGIGLMVFLHFFMKLEINIKFLLILVTLTVLTWLIHKANITKKMRIFYTSCVVFLCINSFLFTQFYPKVLSYMGSVTSAKFINEKHDGIAAIIDNDAHKFGFEYYLKKPVKRIPLENLNTHKDIILYANKWELILLKQREINYSVLKEFNNFRVTKVNGKFLNPETRASKLDKVYVLQLQ